MAKITKEMVNTFMRNVTKTDMKVHKASNSDVFGRVTLKNDAKASKSGSRKYVLSGSTVAHGGCYTAAGLRKAFEKSIEA